VSHFFSFQRQVERYVPISFQFQKLFKALKVFKFGTFDTRGKEVGEKNAASKTLHPGSGQRVALLKFKSFFHCVDKRSSKM